MSEYYAISLRSEGGRMTGKELEAEIRRVCIEYKEYTRKPFTDENENLARYLLEKNIYMGVVIRLQDILIGTAPDGDLNNRGEK